MNAHWPAEAIRSPQGRLGLWMGKDTANRLKAAYGPFVRLR